MALTLMYITNDPAVALIAEKNGVDRIWIDLERLGKEERQKNMNTVKSHHTVRDIEVMAKVLTRSELMVRINPWNENSVSEIEAVISAGAERIMLPMWKSKAEVDGFLKAVGGRVATTLLLETKEAAECFEQVLDNPLVDEIHIGLNDLHLSYGLTFMFELISNGMVEALCETCKRYGKKYGFGGIARIGEGDLPAERIVMEHYRMGSTRAILSRSFCNVDIVKDIDAIEKIFGENMKTLRNFEESISLKNSEEFVENSLEVKACVDKIVERIRERRAQ